VKRFGTTFLAVVAALTLLLLFVDVQAAKISDKTDSFQTMARAKGNSAPVGNTLRVYLAGDLMLAGELKAQMAGAVKELPFTEVRFLDEIPQDANDNPFLAIVLDEDRGLWTPVFATRHVQATIHYAQGSPVDRDKILTPAPGGVSATFSNAACAGECTEGRRTLTLNATAVGLVSLPHMRAHAAGKVAQEAVTLVVDGLPEHLNPAKWSARAHTLAREKLGAQPGGYSSSFQRLAGCRGGIVSVGGQGAGADWSLMYYDAGRDAITETLTRSELQGKLPGVQLMDMPGIGSGENGWSLYLGGSNAVTMPAGTCSLSGWQLNGN
jgi:hypothetical protein